MESKLSNVQKEHIQRILTNIYVNGYNSGLQDDLKNCTNSPGFSSIDSEVNRRVTVDYLLVIQEVEGL